MEYLILGLVALVVLGVILFLNFVPLGLWITAFFFWCFYKNYNPCRNAAKKGSA